MLEVLTDHKCLLAEGPVWDARRKVICWIDILNGQIHEYSPRSSKHRITNVDQMIGSIALCEDDRYFVAGLQHGFAFINKDGGEVTMIHDPEENVPNNRFNDGRCDPAGRFWAGTMSLTEDTGAGSLYTLEANLQCSKKIGGVTISNGMAWSADMKTMYYTDTPTQLVVAYDYDVDTGRIDNKRVIIQIQESDGHPDGMAIDSEGMLWIAHWNGWQLTRWNPKTGAQIHVIKLPVAKITSCTFGGENLRDLYITSAKVDLTEKDLREQPLAGSVFLLRDCGFTGLRPAMFKGRPAE